MARPVLQRLERLESDERKVLSFKVSGTSCRVRGLSRLLEGSRSLPWLECRQPGRFVLAAERDELPGAGQGGEEPLPIELVEADGQRILGLRHVAPLDEFRLAMRALRLGTHGGFERLICVPLVRDIELLDHQLRTVKTVLRRFRARAMLCDEVGLGKTIEAGLVLSELHVRGLVRSVLIVTPPSLVEQWRGEMRRKFSLDFTTYDDLQFRRSGTEAWQRLDRIIVSLHTAKREPHRSAITARRWDMVIIDEAHHLRNRNTLMWRFASQLEKQYVLLLTATPVQNNLEELFNLVTLLQPGLLSTSKQFQRRFVDRRDKLTLVPLANARRRELTERVDRQVARMNRYYEDLRRELQETGRRSKHAEKDPAKIERRLTAIRREQQTRVAELRAKSTLEVQVRLASLLEIFQPKVMLTMQITGPRGTATPLQLVWDPALESFEAVACPGCTGPTFVLSAGRLGCPQCQR